MDRPDWGTGGEARSVAVATPAYRTADEVPPGTAMTGPEVAALAQHGASTLPAVSNDPHAIVPEIGVAHSLIQKWQRSADGFERSYERYLENLFTLEDRADTPKGINEALADLPDSVKGKLQDIICAYSGLSAEQVYKKLKGVMTLDEASVVDPAWARLTAGALR